MPASRHDLVIADTALRGRPGFHNPLEAVDAAGLDLVHDAVTTTAARVLGIAGHRLEVGGNADLVVRHHATLREVLTHHEAPHHVIASGRRVAGSTSSTDLSPDVRRILGEETSPMSENPT